MEAFKRAKSASAHTVRQLLSDAAACAGLYRIGANVYGGVGVIFMLHRVVEKGYPNLYPGYIVDADTLDWALRCTRRHGWEIISLDEMHLRLVEGRVGRRFACFTFDDGYLDNLRVALPVFRKHNAPFSVNICTGILDRSIFYWWGGAEQLLLREDRIDIADAGGGRSRTLWARTWQEKRQAFDTLDDLIHKQGPQIAVELFKSYGVDVAATLDRDAMTITQARELAADPLVTIGAHCVTHQRLCQMSDAESLEEIRGAKRRLEDWLAIEVRHMAYPFGGPDACGTREFNFARQAGFKTAVTTRRGNLFPEHREYLHALPRRASSPNRMGWRNALSGFETFLRGQPKFQTA